jgi:hypothetical protein
MGNQKPLWCMYIQNLSNDVLVWDRLHWVHWYATERTNNESARVCSGSDWLYVCEIKFAVQGSLAVLIWMWRSFYPQKRKNLFSVGIRSQAKCNQHFSLDYSWALHILWCVVLRFFCCLFVFICCFDEVAVHAIANGFHFNLFLILAS